MISAIIVPKGPEPSAGSSFILNNPHVIAIAINIAVAIVNNIETLIMVAIIKSLYAIIDIRNNMRDNTIPMITDIFNSLRR